MNIQSITPSYFVNNSNIYNQHVNANNHIMPKYSNRLSSDTVSFSGSMSKVSDFLEAQIGADTPRLSRIATTYLDVLESVAFRLKDLGFSFDRTYCELSPVKSPKSYTSKVVRSGNFKVPDTIRATLYCNNPYDLSLLNDALLPEMKKRGYVLADTEMSITDLVKRGYVPSETEMKNPSAEKIVPDLDIRLEDVSDQVLKLDPGLRYSISKPQKSGYEDIQMRFVRDFDRKKNPVQHELIILFGPHTAVAKHEESENVYNYLRKLDELRVDLKDKTVGSHSYRASRYIDLIRQMFRGKVSEKLFLNAKNKDLYEMSEEVPISFSETDIAVFENYFLGLRDRVNSVYSEAKRGATVSDSARKQLAKDLRYDRTVLAKIHDGLRATIDHYNYKHDLKNG